MNLNGLEYSLGELIASTLIWAIICPAMYYTGALIFYIIEAFR